MICKSAAVTVHRELDLDEAFALPAHGHEVPSIWSQSASPATAPDGSRRRPNLVLDFSVVAAVALV